MLNFRTKMRIVVFFGVRKSYSSLVPTSTWKHKFVDSLSTYKNSFGIGLRSHLKANQFPWEKGVIRTIFAQLPQRECSEIFIIWDLFEVLHCTFLIKRR